MVSGIRDRLQEVVAERKQDQWRNENKIRTHGGKTRTRSRISLPEKTKRKAEKEARAQRGTMKVLKAGIKTGADRMGLLGY